MQYPVTFLALLGCALAASFRDPFEGLDRIVNGQDAAIDEIPYQVSLFHEISGHHCGGSIIAEDIVVTAAHCIHESTIHTDKVRLGSALSDRGGHLVAIKALKTHELYNNNTIEYDVAVLKLAEPVPESLKVQYISLAESLPESGSTVVASGWGRTCTSCSGSNVLKKVELSFVSTEYCASDEFHYGSKIKESMICAYTEGKDSCQMDSGGPLTYDGQLIGVVSWGKGCAAKNLPGVYADVPFLRDWILETAQSL